MSTNSNSKIDEILKATQQKGSDTEATIDLECYVNVRRNDDGTYEVNISPHWPLIENAEDTNELNEDQLREFLGALGVD